MAVPTTLSGAEMTRIHRRARAAPTSARRPCARGWWSTTPTLSASQPLAELAASALNALGHAVEGPCTPLANPVATLAAHDGARLLARSLREQPDRDGARARRAAGRLRDRLDRLRAAPRALADARAARGRRRTARPTRCCSATRSARSPGASRSASTRSASRSRTTPRTSPRACAGSSAPRGCATSASSGDVLAECADGGGRAARARPHARRAPTGPSCWHSTRGHGERRTEGRRGEDARRGRARRRDRHLRALLRAARVGRDGDARRRRPRPALRRPRPTTTCPTRPTRGARQGRRDQAQRRARDEHGHGAGEVAARGQGGQDLPRHHRRAGARAAQARTARGSRSCS